MPAFAYQALDPTGKSKSGILDGDSARQVRQRLRDQGLAPTKVELTTQQTARKGFSLGQWFQPSLSVTERALVTRQLATLIGAGLPVEEALLAVSKQTASQAAEGMLVTVRSRVMEGYSLARSFEAYPKAFPDLYRATIAAGESSGHLDAVLLQLADLSESQHESRTRIQQAMIYPIVLFALTILILAGLLGYVVPDIVEVFSDTGQALPGLTLVVIAASDWVAEYGFYTLIIAVCLAWLASKLLARPANKLRFDRYLLHAPLLRSMSRGRNTSQFASTLSILSASGVPLVEAMKIASEVVSNVWLRPKIQEATVKVSEGSSLQSALSTSGYFPPMMLYMIGSGEQSGELDSMLARVAKYMEQEVESLLSTLLSLLGPVMLIVMGGAVFTIVMAILLPIINLNQLVA